MNVKYVLGKLLMAFVLISIGFAVGKEMALRSIAQNGQGEPSDAALAGRPAKDKVIAYYMHATFRCLTCNSIEAMAKEVIENDFADALADGRLEWHSVNFQENAELGRRYGVGTSTLVLVKIRNGQQTEFKRLDEVWTKVNDPTSFKQYIDQMIQAYLDGGRG